MFLLAHRHPRVLTAANCSSPAEFRLSYALETGATRFENNIVGHLAFPSAKTARPPMEFGVPTYSDITRLQPVIDCPRRLSLGGYRGRLRVFSLAREIQQAKL